MDALHIGGIIGESLEVARPTVESQVRDRVNKESDSTVPLCSIKSNILAAEGEQTVAYL